jgi:hypothetical protein
VAVDTSGVLAGKTLTQISAGSQSTASWTDQERRTAGVNQYGEIGTGTSKKFVYADVPVAVPTGGDLASKTLVQIAAGGCEVCALDQQHAVYCWTHNPHGLGNLKD